MEKKYILIICCLFLAFSLKGKDEIVISLSGKSIAPEDYGLRITEVVDATNGMVIGEARLGPLNKTVPIYPQRTLQEEVQGLFNRHDWTSSQGEEIIFKINKIWLSEILEATEGHAIAELNVSFIKRGEGFNTFNELFQAAVVVVQDGKDMAGRHDEGLLFAIYESLKDFRERKEEGKLTSRPVELPASPENTIRKVWTLDYPEGVFHSFYDFRDGIIEKEDDNKYVYKTTKAGNLKWADLKTDAGIDTGSYWGFSDGDQVFVLFGNHYYPLRMEPLTHDIILRAPAETTVEGSLLYGLTFGVVGGAVDMTANLIDRKYLDYKLDDATGRFISYEDWEEEFAPAKVHFYTADLKDGSEQFEIYLNGAPVCQLGEFQYIDLLAEPKEGENEVCVVDASGNRKCENFIFDYGGNYVVLCDKNFFQKPKIELLQIAESELVLSEIEKGTISAGCQ